MRTTGLSSKLFIRRFPLHEDNPCRYSETSPHQSVEVGQIIPKMGLPNMSICLADRAYTRCPQNMILPEVQRIRTGHY